MSGESRDGDVIEHEPEHETENDNEQDQHDNDHQDNQNTANHHSDRPNIRQHENDQDQLQDDDLNEEVLDFFEEDENSKKRKREDEGRRSTKRRLLQQKEASPVHSSEGSIQSSEESHSDDEEKLYYGEEDKRELMSLPEAERDEILFERSEKRKEEREQKRIRREKRELRRQSRELNQEEEEETHHHSKRSDVKSSALDDIMARRNQRTKGGTPTKRIFQDGEERQRETKLGHRRLDFDDREEGEADGDGEGEGEGEVDGDGVTEVDRMYLEKRRKRRQEQEEMREINYNDLKDATVLRGKLEKWYGKPFWEKAIISLFVRIMVGQGKNGKEYRIAQIVQIVPSVSTYKLGKKECNQLLTLKIANKTKNFEMRYVSNDPVTEGEYDMWLKFLKKCNEEIPTVEDFERLKQKIYDADHYTYTEEDVEKEVRRNRENSLIPVNITKEKMRISQLISLELASGDKSKIASLEAQLKELNEKELEMEKLKRTGRKSFEKEKKVDQEEKAHKNKQKFSSTPKAKAETFDPYARRTTKVSVSWITAQKKEPAPTVEGGPVVSESDKSNVKEKAPKPKNVSKKILDMDLDISQLSSKVPVPFQKPQVTATALDSSVSEANTLSLTDFLKKKSLN